MPHPLLNKPNEKLGVIGIGVMGKTLLNALLERNIISSESVWAASKTTYSKSKIEQELGIPTYTQYDKTRLEETRILLLCVKPNKIPEVLDNLKAKGLPSDVLIISIAAGKTISSIEEQMVTPNPVIRAMPNTPSIVGMGMTALCAGSFATEEHMALAHQIFEAVGECVELDEQHFDAVTGLCGSGPAYLYLIMEALADGGVRVGLPRDVALKIVSQTVLGAASMVRDTGRHPASLRDDVTTPAGCTIAGLLTLEDGKIRSVLARAVEEATITAKGLGQQ